MFSKKKKPFRVIHYYVGEPELSGGKIFYPVVKSTKFDVDSTRFKSVFKEILDYATTKKAAESKVKGLNKIADYIEL